jgi:hypothetical protein
VSFVHTVSVIIGAVRVVCVCFEAVDIAVATAATAVVSIVYLCTHFIFYGPPKSTVPRTTAVSVTTVMCVRVRARSIAVDEISL